MRELNHPNLLDLLEHYEDEEKVYLVMQYCRSGTLIGAIGDEGVDEEDCKKIMVAILSGLVYLHGRGIAHRDIKCENIMVDTSQL